MYALEQYDASGYITDILYFNSYTNAVAQAKSYLKYFCETYYDSYIGNITYDTLSCYGEVAGNIIFSIEPIVTND